MGGHSSDVLSTPVSLSLYPHVHVGLTNVDVGINATSCSRYVHVSFRPAPTWIEPKRRHGALNASAKPFVPGRSRMDSESEQEDALREEDEHDLEHDTVEEGIFVE